jgi:hypothetical protein
MAVCGSPTASVVRMIWAAANCTDSETVMPAMTVTS